MVDLSDGGFEFWQNDDRQTFCPQNLSPIFKRMANSGPEHSHGVEGNIDFVSMVVPFKKCSSSIKGMFITDEIYRDDGTELGMNLPGGAGPYPST